MACRWWWPPAPRPITSMHRRTNERGTQRMDGLSSRCFGTDNRWERCHKQTHQSSASACSFGKGDRLKTLVIGCLCTWRQGSSTPKVGTAVPMTVQTKVRGVVPQSANQRHDPRKSALHYRYCELRSRLRHCLLFTACQLQRRYASTRVHRKINGH